MSRACFGQDGDVGSEDNGSSLLVEDVVDGGVAAILGLATAFACCMEAVLRVAGGVVRVERLR